MSEKFRSWLETINNQVLSVSYDKESLKADPDPKARVAGHCVIYAKTQKIFEDRRGDMPLKAFVMMQARFDGMFGFPGGIMDPEESVVDGVNREMAEEINLDLTKVSVTEDDFVMAQVMSKPDSKHGQTYDRIKLFCFAKEVTEAQFVEIERRAMDAEHFGTESLGLIRPPLHRYRETLGFPTFLKNVFAGTSKSQLLAVLERTKILKEDEIMECYKVHHD